MTRRRRRGRAFPGWWTSWWAGGIALLVLVCMFVGLTSVTQTACVLALAAFVIVVNALAEATLALQTTRLRAVEHLARDHARELGVYAEHCMRAINDIRRVSPMAATEHEAALTLDLSRLHALGAHIHRQEHHARRDA